MAAIALFPNDLKTLKADLHAYLDGPKSSHISEALAYALGFNTHAGLLANLKESNTFAREEAEVRLLNDNNFIKRLSELDEGSSPDWWAVPESAISFDEMFSPVLIETYAPSAHEEIRFETPRQKAWRALMVAGINAGLQKRHFTLLPGGDLWKKKSGEDCFTRFSFHLAPELYAVVNVTDISFDELSICVLVNPTARGRDRIQRANSYDYDLLDGEATAFGWLERRNGAWLQYSPNLLHCKKKWLGQISTIDVQPKGYGDKGRFLL